MRDAKRDRDILRDGIVSALPELRRAQAYIKGGHGDMWDVAHALDRGVHDLRFALNETDTPTRDLGDAQAAWGADEDYDRSDGHV